MRKTGGKKNKSQPNKNSKQEQANKANKQEQATKSSNNNNNKQEKKTPAANQADKTELKIIDNLQTAAGAGSHQTTSSGPKDANKNVNERGAAASAATAPTSAAEAVASGPGPVANSSQSPSTNAGNLLDNPALDDSVAEAGQSIESEMNESLEAQPADGSLTKKKKPNNKKKRQEEEKQRLEASADGAAEVPATTMTAQPENIGIADQTVSSEATDMATESNAPEDLADATADSNPKLVQSEAPATQPTAKAPEARKDPQLSAAKSIEERSTQAELNPPDAPVPTVPVSAGKDGGAKTEAAEAKSSNDKGSVDENPATTATNASAAGNSPTPSPLNESATSHGNGRSTDTTRSAIESRHSNQSLASMRSSSLRSINSQASYERPTRIGDQADGAQRPAVAAAASAPAAAAPEVVPRFYSQQQQYHQPANMPGNGMIPNVQIRHEIKVEKDFIFTNIPKYTPRDELIALEAVDYKFDDSLSRGEAQLLRTILNFTEFTGPNEYVTQMRLIVEIEDAFAQRDQWKHIKRQMAVVRKYRDNPQSVGHAWVDISCEDIPGFVNVGDRVLLTSGVGRRFGNSIQQHQKHQNSANQVSNVYATIVVKTDRLLCIAPNSQLPDAPEYTMQYVLSRMNYQLEQYALDRLHTLRLAPLLFPHADPLLPIGRVADIPVLRLIDQQLDERQSLAVRSIVAGLHHPRPFVLSGVAGSGKMRVIVETVLQLYLTLPKSKILITSAANNILDELLLRLDNSQRVEKEAFLRLNSATAGHTDTGENPLHNLINPHDDQRARRLAKLSTCVSKINTIGAEVTAARLVLCTLSVCGRIAMSKQVNWDNFTHILVVKAEAANETTCLVPLACLSGKDREIRAHVILCGDTAQLGPIVKSPVSKRMHYGRSMLERLEKNPLYSAWDGVLSVRLRRNYRSLPELLELPNQLSYNGQMEAGVQYTNQMKSELATTFAGYPILFHSVENGQPVREPRSCSWSNISEANIVIAYVYYYMDLGVSVDDIGIITPYKQQMKTIQKGIVDFSDTPHRNRLRIGSVEEFQGREKKIIIVSTVRNNKLGFINSRKRINVMLTRATSMLIIVGNGDFLSNDMSDENDWKDVIRHCRKQPGAFISTK